MSLINCPDCSKQISDYSKICIHCGRPIYKNIDNHYKESLNRLIGKKINISVYSGGVHISGFSLDFSYDLIVKVTDIYFEYEHFGKDDDEYAVSRKYSKTLNIDKIISIENNIENSEQRVKDEIEIKNKAKREQITYLMESGNRREVERKAKESKENLSFASITFVIIFSVGWLIFCHFFGAPIWIPFLIALIWSATTLS